MSTSTVDVILCRNEIGFFAHSPSLKGCHGLGDTPEEALAGFKASLEFYAQTLPDEQGRALLESMRLDPVHRRTAGGSSLAG